MRLQRRAIRDDEVTVIVEALRVAPTADAAQGLAESAPSLRVVGRCQCGCASVNFVPGSGSQVSIPVADGIGTTEAGGTVGVLVWAVGDQLSGLEIYDLGAGEGDQTLPVPGSIRPFDDEASPNAESTLSLQITPSSGRTVIGIVGAASHPQFSELDRPARRRTFASLRPVGRIAHTIRSAAARTLRQALMVRGSLCFADALPPARSDSGVLDLLALRLPPRRGFIGRSRTSADLLHVSSTSSRQRGSRHDRRLGRDLVWTRRGVALDHRRRRVLPRAGVFVGYGWSHRQPRV